MSIQNQDKVLIRSIRSKRAFQKIYLPMYIAAALLSVLFAFWMSQLVRTAELKHVSFEKNLKSVEYLQEEDGKLVITAEVNVAGRVVGENEYSFTLKDEAGKKVATQKCNEKGLVKFNVDSVTGAGEYVYTVSENLGDIVDVVYDESVYTVKIKLVEGEDDLLKLKSHTVTVEGESADGIRFLNEFREPVVEAFWASLLLGLFCLFIPIAIFVHTLIHRRLRRASIVVTESRLMCRYGKKKKLDISLMQVKNLRLQSKYMGSISFSYAGKKRTVRFIQNRQDIFGVIERQKKALIDAESEDRTK